MLRTTTAAACALLAGAAIPACIEFRFRPQDDPEPGDSPGSGWGGGPRPGLAEICNGLDDDDDGTVDEGYPDEDADGLADCLECVTTPAAVGAAEIETGCGPDAGVIDPWDVVVEWQVDTLDDGEAGVFSFPPVVGDLDGDGIPEVVVNTYASGDGTLSVLDGRDGHLKWSRGGVSGGAALLMADMDGDGATDLLAHTEGADYFPILFAASGHLEWTGTERCERHGYCVPVVADLAGDGVPEFLSGEVVYDGASGNWARTLPIETYPIPAIGDVDLDGEQEIAIEGCLYDRRFVQRWCREEQDESLAPFAALVQADDDDEAEILTLGCFMDLRDPDGTLLLWEDLRTSGGPCDKVPSMQDTCAGPPAIADFDGDGVSEVAFGFKESLQVRKLDGTLLWVTPIYDETCAYAGVAGFDFDADGAAELVVSDMENIFFLDGRTGAVRWSEPRHYSATSFEHPVIADVDADGAAELVVVSSPSEDASGWGNVTVFGHAGAGWPSAPPSWRTFDYQVTNVDEDGTVPAHPEPPWLAWNLYKAQPAAGGNRADLEVEITGTCAGSCFDAGWMEVAFQVRNVGLRSVEAGAPIRIYSDDGRRRALLDETATTARLRPGEVAAGQVVRLRVGDVPMGDLVVAVDDDGVGGQVPECDERDNEARAPHPCGG